MSTLDFEYLFCSYNMEVTDIYCYKCNVSYHEMTLHKKKVKPERII